MAPPTILAHKSAFLHAQTLQLSQALSPSAGWRASWEATADENENEAAKAAAPRLTAKAVDEAVYKLNHKLQQHVRRVYAPQATRNVAEQTDALFLGLGTTTADAEADENSATGNMGGLRGVGEEEEEDIRQGVDLGAYFPPCGLPNPTPFLLACLLASRSPRKEKTLKPENTTNHKRPGGTRATYSPRQ